MVTFFLSIFFYMFFLIFSMLFKLWKMQVKEKAEGNLKEKKKIRKIKVELNSTY